MLKIITIKSKLQTVLLVLFVSMGSFSHANEALNEPVTVLYPDMAEPYRSIFTDIINGIEGDISNPLLQYVLKKGEKGELEGWLKEKNCSVVIALGKQGLSAVSNLVSGRSIIAGAVLSPPKSLNEKIHGITLSPSPDKLFQRLLLLSPQVKRVNIIYSEKYSKWLIPFAHEAAKKNNLTLNAIQAGSLSEAATLYRDLIKSGISSEDAIWLPHDNVTVDHRTILPMILKEAWRKQFVVFSNNPAYVKRGVLFALFPDNNKMGGSIAVMTKNILARPNDHVKGMRPLEDLKIAVNVRTADHLDLNISSSDRRSFSLIFPAPR